MVLSDQQILEMGFIKPMAQGVFGKPIPGVISYGPTSYGYDARISKENIKVFSPINAKEIDPKNFDPYTLVTPTFYMETNIKNPQLSHTYFHIPPHGFALCETLEEFHIPREYVCLVVGKSTYARCFSGDTKVKLVDGTSPTLKEMSDDYLLSGKSFYGFGFDTNKNKYVAQKLVAPRKIGKEKVLIINLDNNKEIKCTPDHIFYLRSGKTKRADQLKNGDSLLPLYTGLAQGYERVWDPFNRKFLPVSHMVDSMLVRNGKLPIREKNCHIHHKAEVIRNLNLHSDITEETLTQALLESGTVRGASKLLKVDRSAFRRFPKIMKAFKEKTLQNNHKILTISTISQKEEDVYCLTATETGNFALDAGVIVSNCGLIVNVTPGEPEWIGKWTVELSNTTSLPIRVYLDEGIMQCLFFRGERTCKVSYADKKGKYQNQSGMTPPKVIVLQNEEQLKEFDLGGEG